MPPKALAQEAEYVPCEGRATTCEESAMAVDSAAGGDIIAVP